MIQILTSIRNFFNAEKTVYSHRNRTIEIIALEKKIDIDSIENDTKAILESEGRHAAIIEITKRFHVPLSVAWIFVDRLDKN